MRRKHRGRLGMTVDVIDAVQTPMVVTRISRFTGISYNVLVEILGNLLECEAVKTVEPRKVDNVRANAKQCYVSTDKGYRIMRDFRKIQNTLGNKQCRLIYGSDN